MNSAVGPALRDLSFSEKLILVEDLWDDLASQPNGIPLSSAVKQELDRRYAVYPREPGGRQLVGRRQAPTRAALS